MRETTVYVPDDISDTLARRASATGRSQSALIREAVSVDVARTTAPRPRGGLFASGAPSISERVDELLVGFGED
jgi:hypothetical protein